MNRSALKLALALSGVVLPIFANGCATIIKGTKEDISIQSTPTGAQVVVTTRGGSEVFSGATPTSFKLAKKKEYYALIKMPGYIDTRVNIDQDFQFWVLGNLICGGIIGGAVDALTGAFWTLEPDEISVTLRQATVVPAPAVIVVPGTQPSAARSDDGAQMVATFLAKDSEGRLRSLAIPLVREPDAHH